MTSASRPRLGALVASLVVLAFVAGSAAGVAADRFLARRTVLRTTLDDMAGVLDRLELTPAQRVRADSIVARTAPRSQAIMIETAQQLLALSDSIDAELRAILGAEQQLRLDSLRREPRFVLKRRSVTPGVTKVDTLLDTGSLRRMAAPDTGGSR